MADTMTQLTPDPEPRTFRVVMPDPAEMWAHPVDAEGNPSPLTFDDSTDAGLRRLLVVYLRDLEDINAGHARQQPRWVLEHWIARVRGLLLSRAALRMRYGAGEKPAATHSWDRYYRLGQSPSYKLAAVIDLARWQRGMASVLEWGPGPAAPRCPVFRTGDLP